MSVDYAPSDAFRWCFYMLNSCLQVKIIHDMHMQAQRESGNIAPNYSQARRQKGVKIQHHVPAALPRRKMWCRLYRRPGRLRERSERPWQISAPGFGLRTLHPHGESLYRLVHPDRLNLYTFQITIISTCTVRSLRKVATLS